MPEMRSDKLLAGRRFGWVLAGAAALAAFAVPSQARASDDDEPARVVVDARLEGLKVPGGKDVVGVSNADGKALVGYGNVAGWLTLALVSGITIMVMFKDAKRSHLD